jgi:anti-sigma-K factor RskA
LVRRIRDHIANHDREIAALQSSVQDANETLRLLQAPGVQIVPVEGTAQPQAFARVYLDHKSGTLYMYAAGLHAPAAGKTYQLWLLNDKQQAISSGTFDVDPHGQASIKRQTPQDVGRLVAVAVTDEPAGGSPQPTGTKQLVGKVQ